MNRVLTSLILLAAMPAFAGTTTVDFTQGVAGLAQAGVTGGLSVDENCNAVFSGAPTYMVANGGSAAASGGTVSITMGVTPASDVSLAGNLGLIVYDPDIDESVFATVSQSGLVTLSTNGHTQTDTAQFVAPAAPNAAFTLSYNPNTTTATVTIAGAASNASISNLFLTGFGGPVQIGVVSFGDGKFREFSATGSGIPTLDSTGTCGAEGEGEGSPSEGEPEGEPEGEGEGTPEGEGEEAPALTILGGGLVEDGDALRLSIQVDPGFASYQWRKDGADLGGETNPELLRDPVNLADAGAYDVVVDTGAKAIVTSPPTVVTVVPPNSLPVGGTFALALLTGALAVAAARKKR